MFLPGQVSLTPVVSTIPTSRLAVAWKLFYNESSSLGIEQHLIKSMFVFCLMSSALLYLEDIYRKLPQRTDMF